MINCGWNNNLAVKIVACWVKLKYIYIIYIFIMTRWVVLLYMVDVIPLIVTVLSDRPSLEWECNVTGRLIWFRPLKWTFSTCFRVVVALSNGMDAMLFAGFGAGAVLGLVTEEGGDWVVLTSHFYGSHKGSWTITASLFRLCALYCGLFWNLYGSYISARPQLSWKKQGNFSFDNIGPLL